MDSDNEYTFVSALPTPTDIPYKSPSRALPQRSSRLGLPQPSSSPSPFLPGGDSYQNGHEADMANDRISVFDPRRFTPTLQASLVSEILSLRREVDNKNDLVIGLEDSLHAARIENDKLNENLINNSKENKFMKRQMQLLEGGTLSALEDLAKEKNDAEDTLADVKKRFELSQKKIRTQEEDSARTHAFWTRDKETWEDERRNLDRKLHVAEARLKAILAEVAVAQARGLHQSNVDSEAEDDSKASGVGRGSDTTSNRSESVQSRRRRQSSNSTFESSDVPTGRFSSMSGTAAFGGTKLNGMSLAEELELDEDATNANESDFDDGIVSPEALPEEFEAMTRSFSRQSLREDSKARKVLGLHTEDRGSIEEEPSTEPWFRKEEAVQAVQAAQDKEKIGMQNHRFEERTAKLPYADTATQFTPPSSPKVEAQLPDCIAEKEILPNPEYAANQRRKRVTINPVTFEQTSAVKPSTPPVPLTVSQASQTIEQLPSPPWTPNALQAAKGTSPANPAAVVAQSTSTQTDGDESSALSSAATRAEQSNFMTIPVIAIRPPSRGVDPPRNSVMLPPRTKNASCQAVIDLKTPTRSMSIQTEEIRIDQRPVKLPPHLLPSFLLSHLPPPLSDLEGEKQATEPDDVKPSEPHEAMLDPPLAEDKMPPRQSESNIEDAYPGNNDNGPLNKDQQSDLRRPIRVGSLFAGFDTSNKQGVIKTCNDLFCDDDFENAEPIRKTLSKVQNSWRLVPQGGDSVLSRLESDERTVNQDRVPASIKNATRKDANFPSKLTNNVKEPDFRRKALISRGAAAHSQRTRSPSVPDLTCAGALAPAPPFPVPTRHSSRKLPLSASDGSQSPSPNTTGFFGGQSSREHGRPSIKKPGLRKVRSAAAVSQIDHIRSRSRSPPPFEAPSDIPESPQLPPLPRHELPPRAPYGARYAKHRQQPSSSALTCSTDTIGQQTSVVDAIAQTMVGEWMWKYMRRRKSFGLAESPQTEFEIGKSNSDSGSGVRHKRWVWLAPYERAVMWSSKQPTSGSALLGKSGRKLAIQSVLDVKDETPLPKNATSHSVCGRSILILTPQRALKFTATTRERHYVWLSALSFLSHSTPGVNDLATLPPPPSELQPSSRPSPAPSLRRSGIRDSIRIAKSKPRPVINGVRSYSSPISGFQRSTRSAQQESQPAYMDYNVDEEEEGGAEAPHVPRFSNASNNRKRSNTANTSLRPTTPASFRSYSASVAPHRNYGLHSCSSTEHPGSPVGSGFVTGEVRNGGSLLASQLAEVGTDIEASHAGLFDAMGMANGTVRMEAFVERGWGGGVRGVGGKATGLRAKGQRRRRESFDREGEGEGDLFRGF